MFCVSDDPSRHQISDGQVTSGSSYVNKRGMGKCLQSIIYFFIFGVGGGGGGEVRGNLEGMRLLLSAFLGQNNVSQRFLGVHMQEYPPFLPIRPTALVSASKSIAN